MVERVSSILRDLHQRLLSLYGERLDRVILFGSHARGDAGPGADIDVLVVINGKVRPGEEIRRTGPMVAALCLQHDIVLSCLFMSSAQYRGEADPLLLNVRREGVAV
jgi:predicted nucleotidyltransferase